MGQINNPIPNTAVTNANNSFSTKQTFADEVEIDGALNHDGSAAGFFGTAPASQPSAYTQTYSMADKTHANPTAAALTDSTGQTPDTTIENVPAATTGVADASVSSVNTALTAVEKNLSDLADQSNKNRADVLDVKQLVNSVIDDLQALGLLQ